MAPPVGYALMCGQAALLLGNLLLLHGRGLPGNDSEPRELPPGPPAAAWAYSDPRAPLVLCTYLPDEFVECEEPVDHGGNATAQQELGHGCVKVRAGRGRPQCRRPPAPPGAERCPRRSSAARPTPRWITRACSAGRWTASSAPSRGASCGAAGPASSRRVPVPRQPPHRAPGAALLRRAALAPLTPPRLLSQVHRTLLHHHSALLLLPGLLRSGSVLPGPHRHCRGEAADAGGPGHLVVCGSDPADHRRADAQ
ncbi:hypothetical protein Nmel_018660 [Mimus melanotis]